MTAQMGTFKSSTTPYTGRTTRPDKNNKEIINKLHYKLGPTSWLIHSQIVTTIGQG